MNRPTGSNADEWHLFLSERLDNRATNPNGLTYVAVQIAEAIDATRNANAALLAAAKWAVSGIKEPDTPSLAQLRAAIAAAEESAP